MKMPKKQRTLGMATRTQLNAGAYDLAHVAQVAQESSCPSYTVDIARICNDGIQPACEEMQYVCPQVVSSICPPCPC
jgi:hypothetical protein